MEAPLGRLASELGRARRFVRTDLWSAERYRGLRARDRVWTLAARIVYLVAFGFRRERLRLRAAALTYMTLLSLVPALAVVFSVFTAFGGLEDAGARVRALVITWLAPSQREMVTTYLEQFVGSVHAGALGGVGVLVLLLTALGLLGNVERAFNDIWGLTEHRTLLRRFQAYWPMLTLGPVLIGVSLTVTASLSTSDQGQRLLELPGAHLLMVAGPLLLTWGGCALLYVILPNTRVPLRHALIGGVVAGTLWELAKRGFALYASRAIGYSAIYGSLGAVPLFIVWIYVSWLVVLIGASLTFAVQNARTYEPDPDGESWIRQGDRERLGSRLVLLVLARFEAGQGAYPADALVAAAGGPPRALRLILGELVEAGVLLTTTSAGIVAYAPAKPAQALSVGDVLRVLRAGTPAHASPVAPGPEAVLDQLLSESERTALEPPSRVSFAQILAERAQEAEPAHPVR